MSLSCSRSLQVRTRPRSELIQADPVAPKAQSQTIQAVSPGQALPTLPPAVPEIPAPEIPAPEDPTTETPEALPPVTTIVESDPGFINQVPESSPAPPTIPTPAVVVSSASGRYLDEWLVLTGLCVVIMVAVQ
jgi:hypothetical protein